MKNFIILFSVLILGCNGAPFLSECSVDGGTFNFHYVSQSGNCGVFQDHQIDLDDQVSENLLYHHDFEVYFHSAEMNCNTDDTSYDNACSPTVSQACTFNGIVETDVEQFDFTDPDEISITWTETQSGSANCSGVYQVLLERL